MNKLDLFYKKLLKQYGPQGWWPLFNPKTGRFEYHKGDYSLPKNDAQRFEICLGAILTQNTSWKNVEKAIKELNKNNLMEKKKIKLIDKAILADIIKSSGYHNQKARKLKEFANFYISLGKRKPSREELLSVWGIGRETADSILLYAFNMKSFVVDAYTKRIFSHLKFFRDNEDYDKIKDLFESNLPKDLIIYQEYHALIVEHGKRFYSKKPYGIDCQL